jgi:hypothetical protein
MRLASCFVHVMSALLQLLMRLLALLACTVHAGDEEGQRQEHECEEAVEVDGARVRAWLRCCVVTYSCSVA